MTVEHVAKRGLFKALNDFRKINVLGGVRASGTAQDGVKMAPIWCQEGQDELRWGQEVQERRDRGQGSAKMRKMRDVSSVGAPWRSYEPLAPANKSASPGPGEGKGGVMIGDLRI